MWKSIVKLELKKGKLYYFILILFFFFWFFFTLLMFFLYVNFNYIEGKYFYKNEALVLLSSSSEKRDFNEIKELFKKIDYIKEFKIESPKEIFNMLRNELPKNFDYNDEIYEYFPYLIRIKLISNEKIYQLKRDLMFLTTNSNFNLQLLNEPLFKSVQIWKYFNLIFLFFLVLWNIFYFLIFYFLNKSFNYSLKEQIEIYQLLGGHVRTLRLTRIFIVLFISTSIFLFAFFLYLFLIKKITFLLPIFKIFPDLTNSIENIFFSYYIIFLLIIYPIFNIFFSFKKV